MIGIKTSQWNIDGIEAVFFDKDGTLIDSHVYWGGIIEQRSRALLGQLNMPASEHEGLCLSMGFSLSRKKLLAEGPIALVSREKVIEIVCAYLKEKGRNISVQEMADLFVKVHKEFLKDIYQYIVLLPGVTEILTALRQRSVKTAVITTDSINNTKAIIQHLGLDSYFDLLLGKEATPEPKISGKPAAIALESLNVQKETAICVGDAPMDILMSRNAGCKAGVGIALGQIPYQDLLKETPYVARAYSEIEVQ